MAYPDIYLMESVYAFNFEQLKDCMNSDIRFAIEYLFPIVIIKTKKEFFLKYVSHKKMYCGALSF